MESKPSPALLLIVASKICLPVKGFPTASYLSRVPPCDAQIIGHGGDFELETARVESGKEVIDICNVKNVRIPDRKAKIITT